MDYGYHDDDSVGGGCHDDDSVGGGYHNAVEATEIRITVVNSEKAASFIDLTHINALRRGVTVIGNK